jgi:TetR/AcrR family transcriptional repressor of bet genes
MVARADKVSRRAQAKAFRRQQLIDATINCIARKGLGNTTLADVAREAGLSQGIVNLHFDSKNNLLNATLQYLAEEYDALFMKTLAANRDDPAACLRALLELDLTPAVCDRKKLAVWFAFWGEVKAVPTYREICRARDRKCDEIRAELVEQIIRQGHYSALDARVVADALSAMTDGLWLSCQVNPRDFDRSAARHGINVLLKSVFPNHYS